MVSVRTALGICAMMGLAGARKWLGGLLALLAGAGALFGTLLLWAVVKGAAFVDGLPGARR